MLKLILEGLWLTFLVVNVKLSLDSFLAYRNVFKKYKITSKEEALRLISNETISYSDKKVIKNYIHTLKE